MMVNGTEISVLKVTGKAFTLNCCDSAELNVATSQYAALFSVLWRAFGPAKTVVYLGSPPPNFQIELELDLGCDRGTTSCASASPEERYAQGFTGALQWQYGSSGMTASSCLSAKESPSSPHPPHSLARARRAQCDFTLT